MKLLCTFIFGLATCLIGFGQSPKAVLLETESFADKGGWFIDQQSMDVMGSPYLIAHGQETEFIRDYGLLVVSTSLKNVLEKALDERNSIKNTLIQQLLDA